MFESLIDSVVHGDPAFILTRAGAGALVAIQPASAGVSGSGWL